MTEAIEIRLRRTENRLDISFDDGTTAQLPAEYLRVESPSAEVQGHGPRDKRLVAGKQMVGIASIEPVGNYAVRLIFSDGHDSGIFSWEYLKLLGQEMTVRWSAYLKAIDTAGRSRS